MEFCLVRFISCYNEHQELDFICKIVLNKRLIQVYLEEFIEELIKVEDRIKEEDLNKGFPKKLDKSQLRTIFMIYKDYEMIKDVYSLQRIDHYVTLALDIDLDKEEKELGTLAFQRALQVLGEFLKNTPESPNVSDDVHALLLLSAPKYVREIVTTLRDSLSHFGTLKRKKDLEDCKKNNFYEIRNDLKKIKIVINEIINEKKIEILINKITECNDLSEFEELGYILSAAKLRDIINEKKIVILLNQLIECKDFTEFEEISNILIAAKLIEIKEKRPENGIKEHELIKELIKIFSNEVLNQTEIEEELFSEIDKVLDSHQNIPSMGKSRYLKGLSLIDLIKNENNLKFVKNYCLFFKKMNKMQISPYNLQKIIELLCKIYKSLELRESINQELKLIFYKIIHIIQYDAGRIQEIDDFKEILLKKEDDTESKAEETITKVFEEIKNKLKDEPTLESETFEKAYKEKQDSYKIYKENKELKRKLIFLYDKLKDRNILQDYESVKSLYQETVEILIDKKLDNIHKFLTNGDWKEVKKIADKLCKRDSYETFLNSVTKNQKEERHDMSQCFQDFVRSLDLNKSIKSNINIIIDKIFKNKEQIQSLFEDRLKLLQRLLLFSNICESDSELFRKYDQNKKLQAAVEMIVLDLTEILETSELFGDNRLSFEKYSPLLTGKLLRNYLAHGNALIDNLPSDPSAAILSNALRFIKEGKDLLIKDNVLIGQRTRGSFSDLYKGYRQSLDIITNQNDMFTAAKEGNLKKMKHHIKKGADIKARDYRGWSGLHFAAQGNNVEIFEFFLDLNIPIDIEDICGQTCFHIAATFGSVDVIKYLLDKGVDVNSVSKDSYTALHFAAQNGHLEIIKILLINNANIDDLTNDKDTLLDLAVQNSHVNVVEYLLEHGAIFEYSDNSRKTPLQRASSFGHVDIIKSLIKYGANINAKYHDGRTSLHFAVHSGHKVSIETLLIHFKDKDGKIDFINTKDNDGSTPLHFAVNMGYDEVVEILLEEGAKVNDTYVDDNTSLHLAATYGYERIVEILLKHGADITLKNLKGYTAIAFAVKCGYANVVDIFFQSGCPVDVKDKHDDTLLHIAVSYDRKEVVKSILNKTDKIDIKNKLGQTPLHIAAYRGYTEITDYLLHKNADINGLDKNGWTPLHLAAGNGRIDVVNLLLDQGAKFILKDHGGRTILHLAAFKGHNEIVKYIINDKTKVSATENEDGSLLKLSDMIHVRDKCGETPLMSAVQGGHKEVVQTLLKGGAKEDVRDYCDRTLIHLAVECGFPDIVKILLERKTDCNSLTKDRVTPLHFAVLLTLSVSHKIVQMLLEAGAKVDARNNDDVTPLHLASFRGHVRNVEILLKYGADVTLRNKYQRTAIYLAVRNGHKNVVELLIQNGSSVDLQDEYGNSLLYDAVYKGYKEVVEVLLSKTGRIDITNKMGHTPLHLAASKGCPEIIKLFLNKNANINALDHSGKTPLHVASYNGKIDAVNLLLDHGAKFYIKDRKNLTALPHATGRSLSDIIKRFINEEHKRKLKNENGTFLQLSDMINVRDNYGRTPLFYAKRNAHKEVFERLLLAGAKEDNADCSFFHLVVFGGHSDMVKHKLGNESYLRNSYEIVRMLLDVRGNL